MPPESGRTGPRARVPAREIAIPVGAATLRGVLDVPAGARGLVIFAHGSGSGRTSPRNVWVAGKLGEAGFAGLPTGCFGASTGAAAALLAAARRPEIAAVVSRGGRPDLAGAALAAVCELARVRPVEDVAIRCEASDLEVRQEKGGTRTARCVIDV